MNPAILQYQKEFTAACPKGHKARKILLDELYHSITPLLEEIPSPTYEELVDAIGTPSHMMQTLLDSIDVPPPMSTKKKFAIVSLFCCVALCVGIVSFCLWNVPEHGDLFPVVSYDPKEILGDEIVFAADDEFSRYDVFWDQLRSYNTYLILLNNTNQLPTRITLSYSKFRDPYVFEVPAKTSVAYLVQDARFGRHTLSFNTSDGSLSGSVQVLIQK